MRLLWAVAHGLESTSKRMYTTVGITGPQRLVLRLVAHHGSMSAGEIARTMHIDPSSLTGMLRRLEQAGLLNRKSHPEDRRRVILSLTARGRQLNKNKQGTVEAVVERALRNIPVRELRSAQRAIQAIADEFDDDATPGRR